jgi:hypothetical protein
MLKGIQAEEGDAGYILIGGIYAEDTTSLSRTAWNHTLLKGELIQPPYCSSLYGL